jgi:hypothetical protein
MPVLQKLELDFSSDDLIPLSLPQCAFPALRDLGLTGKMALAFLEALPSSKVEAIRIDFESIVDDVDLTARFYQVLHERCSHQSLSRISVYCRDDFTQPHHPADMLQPLLSFVNLQDISINIHNLFGIDNNFIEAAAKSWPRLRSLALNGQSNITLTGLASLARHCPNLTSLAITIDATVVDHVLDMPVSNTKFDDLYLGCSAIENPTSVAACLSRIFPFVTSIHFWRIPLRQTEHKEKRKYRDHWNEVSRLIKISADVRKMERIGWMGGCSNVAEL